MVWGAFLIGLVPLAANPVLRAAADAFDQFQVGILFGSFTGVLILFSIPVTLLGTISPLGTRLAIRSPAQAGSVSGRDYAISTLAAFLGTFLPVLLFIPTIGTNWTFILFSTLVTGRSYLVHSTTDFLNFCNVYLKHSFKSILIFFYNSRKHIYGS